MLYDRLEQNSPNPFNPSTTIKYSLAVSKYVTLKVYDIVGNEITTLDEGFRAEGYHQVVFKIDNISSGVYFCRLTAGDFTQIRKMVIIR